MQSRYLRILILSAFMVSLFASAGFAARRSSLAGNLLIKDRDDIFFMPQSIHDYNRMVTFDFGTNSSLGNGGMVFGNDQIVFGAFAHKTDFIGAIPTAFTVAGDVSILNSSGSNSFGGYIGSPYNMPMQWVDFVVGFGNEDMPWGIRASLGSQAEKTEPSTGAGTTNDNNSLAFNIVGGTTINQEVEISAEFSFGTATIETTPATGTGTKRDVSPVHFAAAVRKTASQEQEALQLGYLGDFFFITGSDEDTGTNTTMDMTTFGIGAGVGPVYMPHERTTIAMYGTVSYFYDKTETTVGTNPSTEDKGSAFVIPGVNIASEIELASWLQARAGLMSQYVLASDDDTGANVKSSDRFLVYDWYSGIGITLDNFMLDGYFNPSVLTTGTDLLGNTSQLFGMLTATFMF